MNFSKKHIKHLVRSDRFNINHSYSDSKLPTFIGDCHRRYKLESINSNIKCRVKNTLYFDTFLRFVRIKKPGMKVW